LLPQLAHSFTTRRAMEDSVFPSACTLHFAISGMNITRFTSLTVPILGSRIIKKSILKRQDGPRVYHKTYIPIA